LGFELAARELDRVGRRALRLFLPHGARLACPLALSMQRAPEPLEREEPLHARLLADREAIRAAPRDDRRHRVLPRESGGAELLAQTSQRGAGLRAEVALDVSFDRDTRLPSRTLVVRGAE